MSLIAVAVLAGAWQAPPLPPLEHPVLPQLYRSPKMGPAMAELTLGVRVQPRLDVAAGQVTLPVPSDYTGQIVFNIKVQCDPPSALRGWTWEKRPDGLNSVVRVTVAPPTSGALVSWTARVLAPGDTLIRTQKLEYSAWAGSTPVDPILRNAVSRGLTELHGTAKAELPGEAAMWVARYRGGWSATSGRASSPVDGSDSLNRALTCAAILRAMHVPARVVQYVPILLGGDARPMWLTEYPGEDAPWEMIDPAIGLKQPVRNAELFLRIVSLAQEKSLLSEDASGAIVSGLKLVGTTFSNRLIQVFRWSVTSSLMPAARTRSRSLIARAEHGQDDWIDDAVFKSAVDRGPVNLDLVISGRPMLPERSKG